MFVYATNTNVDEGEMLKCDAGASHEFIATDKSLSIRAVEILSDVVDKTKAVPHRDVL